MDTKQAARGTHSLERADDRTGQDIETKRGRRGTHKLERADIETSQDIERQQGELTLWRG